MRRRTGEEEEAADTELKTKTPHVNVGKKERARGQEGKRECEDVRM